VALDFLPYGATAQRLRVASPLGGPVVDVLLGFDDGTVYCSGAYGDAGHPYFGANIGRVANRIRGGAFPFAACAGGVCHTPINEVPGNDTLHGGLFGYDRRVWTVTPLNASAARLAYDSPDGEQGFPGALHVEVTYALSDGPPAWTIDYAARTTDGSDTVYAPTQHAYWNLNGAAFPATEHDLSMPLGDAFVEVDAFLVPTGKVGSVKAAGNEFLDFTVEHAVGRDINKTTRYSWGTGYDNAFVFSDWAPGMAPREVARVFSPHSNIGMAIVTDQPSLQVYSGNFLNGSIPQKASQGGPGARYAHWGALALETQHYPDAVNHANFPSVALRAGEAYASRTSYRFF
jgi:aldose 1-epimerase